MRNKHLSTWAEEFDYEELNESASEHNLPLNLLEDARDVLSRTTKRTKKHKVTKHRHECWQ